MILNRANMKIINGGQWRKETLCICRVIDSDFINELQNILKQFTPDRPNAVWCSDITYIWTTDGFVYLTSIMDLFSRKIIAWTLSQTLEVSCVIDTISKAKARRSTKLPLIIHSDRGSQYVSQAYCLVFEYIEAFYKTKCIHSHCDFMSPNDFELLYEQTQTNKLLLVG